MRNTFVVRHILLFVVLLLAACGGDAPAEAPEPVRADGLTAVELEHGIGPVSPLELGPVDAAMAARGEQSYTSKCAACHKVDARYVGPALGDILTRRTPAYVMNMMLNPEEMTKRHPEAKALLAQYMTVMPNQNLTEDEARSILEYLRGLTAGAATAGL